jgi:hypothetical protein
MGQKFQPLKERSMSKPTQADTLAQIATQGGDRPLDTSALNFKAPRPHYSEIKTGDTPRSNEERLPLAARIELERLADEWREDQAAAQARYDRGQEILDQRGAIQFKQSENRRRPNPSEAVEADCTARLERIAAQFQAHNSKTTRTSGNLYQSLRDWVDSGAARGPFRHANVAEPDNPDGWDDVRMLDELKSERAKRYYRIKATEQRPVSQDQLEAAVAASVDAMLTQTANVGGVKKLRKDIAGRWLQGEIVWPEILIPDGKDYRKIPDASSILVEVFRDQIVKFYVKRAMKDFVPEDAIGNAERRDTIAQATAEMLEIERQAEVIFRRLRDAGTRAERLSANPMIVLQLEKADD